MNACAAGFGLFGIKHNEPPHSGESNKRYISFALIMISFVRDRT